MAWRVQGDEPPDAPILCSGEQPVAEIVPNTQPIQSKTANLSRSLKSLADEGLQVTLSPFVPGGLGWTCQIWHDDKEMASPPLKPVIWLGDSLRELKTFPALVQDEMGYAIYLAQRGDKHVSAKPLKGPGRAFWRLCRITTEIRSARCTPFDSPTASSCCTRSRRSRRAVSQCRRQISS